ncbi:MAG: hypothetical protein ABL894_11930 [Hyphomicrobium sp.]
MAGQIRKVRDDQRVKAVCGALLLLIQMPGAKAQDTAPAPLAQQTCSKVQFEAVVDDAAEALRNLNQIKKPDYEERLRQLKDKRGWSHEEFLKAAAPFVKDETIDDFDSKSNALLDKLSAAGEGAASAKAPDCATLLELREQMKVLIETQNAKWAYMFGKLDAELQK